MRAKDLHEHSLYAQIQRNERCMLTGRALTVVCAADDYAAALLLAAGRELRIDVDEAVVGDSTACSSGTGSSFAPAGRMWSVVMLSLDLENDLAGCMDAVERLAQRERLDVRAAKYLDASASSGAGGQVRPCCR